jgi:hypothetical protein
MADATQDDGVLYKKTILGIDLEYTKTDAAIDGALLAGGLAMGGVGVAPAAGIAAVRSGAMMLGRGILRSIFKTAAKEGTEVVAKAAVKSTAEAGAKAAVKEGAEATAEKVVKSKLTDANEDALAALVKAKAAGEAERAGVKAVAKEATEATASTAAKASTEAAAGIAAKTVTKEAVESTSKKVLGAAATAGSYAWTGVKLATFPFRHPVLTLGGVSAAHLATDGKSSELFWDGAVGSWNLTKEYAPAAASAVAEGTLKLGDGMMGFLATGGKKGASELGEHLPPGTPVVLREALGSVGKPKAEGAAAGPSLKDRAGDAFAGAKDKAEDVAENAGDFLEGAHAQPFREMIGKFMGINPQNVNGKTVTAALGQKAKENPAVAMGMALGAMSGMKSSNSKAEMAWKVPMYTALWGIAFMLLGPMLNPLLKMAGNYASDKAQDFKEQRDLKNQFHGAQVEPYANGALPSTAEPKKTPEQVAAPKAEAANASAFRENAVSATLASGDTSRVDLRRGPAANRDQYALAMNG